MHALHIIQEYFWHLNNIKYFTLAPPSDQ